MVPVPPAPRTVRPVVSGAYGCESSLICKVGGGCHSLVPRGSKKTWGGDLGSYSEDTFSVGPEDTQGAMGGRGEAAWLAKMMASCWASVSSRNTCIGSPAQPVGHISASLGAGGYHCRQGRRGHHAWAGRDLPQQLLQAPFASISPQECGAIHAAGLPATMLVTCPDPWPWGHRLQLQRLLVLRPQNSALLSLLFLSSLLPCLLSPPCPSLCVLVPLLSLPPSLSVCLVSLALTALPCLLCLSV